MVNKEFDVVDLLKRKLSVLLPFCEGKFDKLQENFMIEYIFNSNALDKKRTTIEETAYVYKTGNVLQSTSIDSHLDILGHKYAFAYIANLSTKTEQFDVDSILQMHSLLIMDNSSKRGEFREIFMKNDDKSIVKNGSILYYKVEHLLSWYDTLECHVIKKLALFLLKFEEINPFDEGNGRIGRLVINYKLLKHGYLPVNFNYDDMQKYKECFSEYIKTGKSTMMEEMLVDSLKNEYEKYIKLAVVFFLEYK